MQCGLSITGFRQLADNIDAILDLGVDWVKWCVDLDADTTALPRQLELVREVGLQPVIDLRTNRVRVREIATGAHEAGASDIFVETYHHYAARFAAIVGECADYCSDWEWWGEPYCPHVTGGAFGTWDYARSLKVVYNAAHEADPDCRVWTGGFGVNLGGLGVESGMAFLKHLVYSRCRKCGNYAEAKYDACPRHNCDGAMEAGAGQHFDCCNLHPYAHGRDLPSVLAYHDKTFGQMRALLNSEHCAGQPLAANEWGFPTVPVLKTPRFLHSYVLGQGVQALTEAQAPEWFEAMFVLFHLHQFSVVCVHMLDDDLRAHHWGDYCGLRRETPLLWWSRTRRKRQWAVVQKWAREATPA